MRMAGNKFSFETLDVWKDAVDFADDCLNITERIFEQRRHYRLVEQMEAACTSIALNIAEGKGRYSKKEFVQFLYIARGSLFETVTLLEIFKKRNWLANNEYTEVRTKALSMGKRISSLINSIKNS